MLAPELAELAQQSAEHFGVRLGLELEQEQPGRLTLVQGEQLTYGVGRLVG